MLFEATREGGADVPAHTFEQVVENTKLTLLKLVSKDRAIIDLLRMEQGSRGFMDFLADVEDQVHLCHSWESLTGKDMKRTGRWRRRRSPRSTPSSRSSRPP